MKCKNCGKELEKGEVYCTACGAKASGNSKVKKILKNVLMGFGAFMIICLVISMFSSEDESKPNSTSGTVHTSDNKTSQPKTLEFPQTIINNTGVDIYYLYSSVESTNNWEEDILESYGVLENGESVVVTYTLDADSLVWDFKIVDFYDNYIDFYGIDFSDCDMSGATLKLDYDGNEGTATLY